MEGIEQLKTEIIKVYEDYKKMSRMTVEKAIHLGGLLVKVKEEVGHGNFMNWVSKNLPFTHMTAWKYMKVYELREKVDPEFDILTDVYNLFPKKEVETIQEQPEPEPPVEEWTLPTFKKPEEEVSEEDEDHYMEEDPIQKFEKMQEHYAATGPGPAYYDWKLEQFKQIFLELNDEYKQKALDWIEEWCSKQEEVNRDLKTEVQCMDMRESG